MKVVAGALPKYRQLLQLLRQEILSGALAPGARMPTEDELIQTYGLSRGTVRKAIEQLAAEGLVRTEQGSGTYVSTRPPSAAPFRFSDCLSGPGANYRVITRVITKEIVPASMEIAERLTLPLGEPIIHILRQRRSAESVIGFSERYLPVSLCPGLLEQDLTQPSIHDFLVNLSELPLLRAVVEIQAELLGPEDTMLLEASPETIGIIVKRMTYTAPARPAVWYRAVYRDAYCLAVHVDPVATDPV